MIRSIKYINRFSVVAQDGAIGAIDDVYFDDERWAVRYVVVDTGTWLPGRRVLISPLSITQVQWGEQRVLLSISRDQVANSPEIDTHKPVSRQQEAAYLGYMGYPYYWGGGALWGATAFPMLPTPEQAAEARITAAEEQKQRHRGDSHLRSVSEVTGYHIRATDGELGHIDDVLVDDGNWAVRYFVVDTSNWWFGKQVLVAPNWIAEIDWAQREVNIGVTRQTLRNAPTYDRAEHLDRQWELAYYGHVNRRGYWLDGDEAATIKQAQAFLSDADAPPADRVERRSNPR